MPISDTGTTSGGDQRRAIAVQENVDDQDDEGHREQQCLLDLAQRGADGDERSKVTIRSILGSIEFFSSGSSALTASIISMMLAPGCWYTCDEYGRLAVVEAVGADVFGGAVLHVQYRGDIAQPHGRAIAIGDDQVAIRARVARIVVGVDLVVQVVGLDRAFGRVGIGVGNGGADVLQADAVFGQRQRIDFHAHGGQARCR